jgi:shikimate kinase
MPLKAYKKKLAKQISDKLEMIYVDINELLEFELLDVDRASKVAGKEYIELQENKAVRRVASYNNSLITMDLGTLLKDDNIKLLKESSLIIYLKLQEKDYIKLIKKEYDFTSFDAELQLSVFKKRNEHLSKISDIVVECSNANKRDLSNEVLVSINNYYN